ncbi:MAG: sulfotransferase [Candidatus Heimdallarchaeota archaeon]|nr:sulfotransferase [Candidatus Heimdallarchaeota archaeon]
MAKTSLQLKLKRKKAFNLANKGEFESAIDIYQMIFRQNPKDANAAFMLGALYGSLENNTEAVRFSRLAIELDNTLVDAYYNLAQAEKKLGNNDAAIDALKYVIRLNPEHVEALNNLGFLLTSQGSYFEAIKYFQQALKIKPDHIEALINISDFYKERAQYKLARDYIKRALFIEPESKDLKRRLAYIYQISGDSQEAIKLHKENIDSDKNDLESIAALATCYERNGAYEESLLLLKPHLHNNVAAIIATAFSKLAKHFNREEEAIGYLEKAVSESNGRKQPSALYFQLGRLYDSKKDYDNAFQCYQKANQYQKTEFHAKGIKTEHFNDLAKKLRISFTSTFYDKAPRSNILTKRPIFIVGMPRSGTTLTEQILSSHPEVTGADELPDIALITEKLPSILHAKHDYPECLTELTSSALDHSSKLYLERLDSISKTSPYLTDKMPHNFLHLGLINLMFPNAAIIYCTRNPMDNCLSIYFSEFNRMHGYSNELATVGKHYREHVALMKHWKELLGEKILELKYEEMVNDQENNTRRLLDFCGLKWDESCLQFHKSKRVANTISYDQVRQPIYKKSVERWKNYEKHMSPLAEALGIKIGD